MPADHARRADQPADEARRREQATSFGAAAGAYERGPAAVPGRGHRLAAAARRGPGAGCRRGHRQADPPARRSAAWTWSPSSRCPACASSWPARYPACRCTPARPSTSRSPTAAWTRCWWPRPGTGWTRPARCPRWPGCWSPAASSAWSGTCATTGRTGWPSSARSCTTRARPTAAAAVPSLIGPPFGPVQHRTVEWTHRLTRDQLLDMVASRSYIITMPAARAGRGAGRGGPAGRHPPGPGRPGRAGAAVPHRMLPRSAELTAPREPFL